MKIKLILIRVRRGGKEGMEGKVIMHLQILCQKIQHYFYSNWYPYYRKAGTNSMTVCIYVCFSLLCSLWSSPLPFPLAMA